MNKNIKKINIGVIGVGHLGEHHVKHLKSINNFKLIGIHDINEKRAKSIGTKYGIPLYNNINELIEACELGPTNSLVEHIEISDSKDPCPTESFEILPTI